MISLHSRLRISVAQRRQQNLNDVTVKYQYLVFSCVAKPTTAFALCLVAGIIYLIVGIIIAAASSQVGSIKELTGISDIQTLVAIVGAVGAICGIVMIVGSLLMNSDVKSRVRTGAVLVLVFAIVGALFTAGGFFIGFILALVGSILGIMWKGPETTQMPPAPST